MPTEPPRAQPRILLVDDDPVIIQTLRRTLSGLGTLYFATAGQEALRLASDLRPDVVLLDAELPDLSGFEVCEALRADPALGDIPVLFVTRHQEQDVEIAALERGAVDFITKPIRPQIVAMRVRTQLRLKVATDQLRRLAVTDGLTELANRRALDDMLQREWRRCLRSGLPLSVLMIDIDCFKRYNDHYGHGGGDACLVAVARAIGGCVHRPFDLVARYGGEEFVVLLPETDTAGALHVGKAILAAIEAQALPHAASEVGPHVTVSIGASSYDSACEIWQSARAQPSHLAISHLAARTIDAADLIAAADLALYAAKRAGRARQSFQSIDRAVERRLATRV